VVETVSNSYYYRLDVHNCYCSYSLLDFEDLPPYFGQAGIAGGRQALCIHVTVALLRRSRALVDHGSLADKQASSLSGGPHTSDD